MNKISPLNAMTLLRNNLALSASFAVMALDAALAAAEGTGYTLAKGSLELSEVGVSLGNIDVIVDLSEIDTAEAASLDLHARRVEFRLPEGDPETSCIVGYNDGQEVLRIELNDDGELHIVVTAIEL